MIQEFYYSDGAEKANGPHNSSQMGDLLRERVITPLTLVCRPGDEAWQEFRKLQEYKDIRDAARARQVRETKIPANWAKWCKSGSYEELSKRDAVKKCLDGYGQVRGYFSDIVLKPDLVQGDSMYPSFEHLSEPGNHADAVVEARIINSMKSHLSESEFWRVIEHLFIVGVEKSKIQPPFGKRLPKSWSPKRHYKKIVVESGSTPVSKATVVVSPKVAAKISGGKPK